MVMSIKFTSLRSFILLSSVLLLFFSCGEKSTKIEDEDIARMEETLESEPSKQNELALIGTIFRKASEQTNDKEKERYFQYGVEKCASLGYTSEQQSFISELLKCCYKSDQTPERLSKLAALLAASDKKEVASVVYNALYRNFKSSDFAAKVSPEDQKLNYSAYIKSVGADAFEGEGSMGLKREEAIRYIDLTEAFAMVDPRSGDAPDYLWKGAEMARNLGSVEKSLSLYSDLASRYPDNEKAADALFLKGYILETAIGNMEGARDAYTGFVNKYPKHELADDAQFLLENLGKTDADLLNAIQSNK